MVAALLHWSFMALARQFSVCLLKQLLLDKLLLDFGDGGATARFRLTLVFVIIARWSKDQFVIIITLYVFVLLWVLINRSVEFLYKNLR
jgi:hypothetical protein